jgi:hypothetical protein
MRRLFAFFAVAALASCSVPTFELESPDAEALAVCRDGALSPGEADIDCGHSYQTPCASSRACLEATAETLSWPKLTFS